jgi:hypothetical protein
VFGLDQFRDGMDLNGAKSSRLNLTMRTSWALELEAFLAAVEAGSVRRAD